MKACLLALLFVLLLSVTVSMAQQEDLTKEHVSQYLPIAFDMPADWKVLLEEPYEDQYAIILSSDADFPYRDSTTLPADQLSDGEVFAYVWLTEADQIHIEGVSFDDHASEILQASLGQQSNDFTILQAVEPLTIHGLEAAQVSILNQDAPDGLRYLWTAFIKVHFDRLEAPPDIEIDTGDNWLVFVVMLAHDQEAIEIQRPTFLEIAETVRYVPIEEWSVLQERQARRPFSAQRAQEAVRLVLEGNSYAAKPYYCDSAQASSVLPLYLDVTSIECNRTGDEMLCTVNYDDEDQQLSLGVRFGITDNKLCDPQVVTPNG